MYTHTYRQKKFPGENFEKQHIARFLRMLDTGYILAYFVRRSKTKNLEEIKGFYPFDIANNLYSLILFMTAFPHTYEKI